MKTLLISGGTPLPAAIRETIERGSTSLIEKRAGDVDPETALDVDRVVFWATNGDDELRTLAERCARAERRERREALVFVTPDDHPKVSGLAANEVFVWPRDEDRLTMAFMTGA